MQGDATRVPLADGSIDTVVMLGAHRPRRSTGRPLFGEVARILKPGGRLLYPREPVSDFALWRAVRSVVYRLSPMLDHARPSARSGGPGRDRSRPRSGGVADGAVPPSRHGFLGFCVFMNSDVLVFNRLLRLLPGIRKVARSSRTLDFLGSSRCPFGSATQASRY